MESSLLCLHSYLSHCLINLFWISKGSVTSGGLGGGLAYGSWYCGDDLCCILGPIHGMMFVGSTCCHWGNLVWIQVEVAHYL